RKRDGTPFPTKRFHGDGRVRSDTHALPSLCALSVRDVVGLVRADDRRAAGLHQAEKDVNRPAGDDMADDSDLRQQRRASRDILGWGLTFGILLAIVVVLAALGLARRAGNQANISDQPRPPATSSGTTGSSTGTR